MFSCFPPLGPIKAVPFSVKTLSEQVKTVLFKGWQIFCGQGKKPAKASAEIPKKFLNDEFNIRRGTDFSLRSMYDYQCEIVNIASKALNSEDPVLIAMNKQIAISKLDGNGLPTKEDLAAAKAIKGKVISRIAGVLKQQNKLSSRQAYVAAVAAYKEAQVNYLNNKSWTTFDNTITHKQHTYTSTQIPGAEMKLCHHDIFENAYNGKGVCSGDTLNTVHATNLWQSSLCVSENGASKTLFSGIRHGVLSPYHEKDPCKRKEGAENRAKEVLSAALFSKPDLLARALNNEIVDLKIVSTGLLTATNIFGEEASMVDDQMQAWRSLTEIVKIKVRDSEGKLQTVNIRPQVAAFNVGVNELALKFGFGNTKSDKYNVTGMEQLSRWVEEYLATQPENAQRVTELKQQIEAIWKDKLHHKDGNEPYKLAQRISMLAHEIKAVPCWNCKSGKDRTGMLDAEIKREAISLHQGMKSSLPGSIPDNEGRNIFQNVLLNSGNLEIQKMNTCGAGNKVLKNLWPDMINLSLRKRIGNSAVWASVKGLSSCVSS